MKHEKSKIVTAVGFALIVLVLYSIGDYVNEKKRLLAQIDETLFIAASAIPFVLEDDFHDRAVDAYAIDDSEDRRNILNLSKLSDRYGMKFLYSVILDQNGTYRLSSSSALREELEQGKEVHYFTPYPDASVALKESFEDPKTVFSQRNDCYHAHYIPIFSDRWGTYRSIFIPMRSPLGRHYAVAADVDITYVEALLRQNTLHTIVVFMIFALAILPIIVVYVRTIKRKNTEYQQVHELYLDHSKRSVTDALTGVYNRFKLDKELDAALEWYHQRNRPFALIMLDIDHFKEVNDEYGHQKGDEVLKHIAQLLVESSRSTDIVGRWGGEEFMIITPETNLRGGFLLAEKLRKAIETYALSDAQKITASFGVTEPRAGISSKQLLQEVDEALYEAKHKGRNQSAMFTPPPQ